ncbi:CHAT domain-containing protein [Rhizobium leguminosarum]|uniref:CHAT domain-containing protein n=1 Tax=Rhizobium leguminosarum TaxID=384 RepID=UPI0039657D19
MPIASLPSNDGVPLFDRATSLQPRSAFLLKASLPDPMPLEALVLSVSQFHVATGLKPLPGVDLEIDHAVNRLRPNPVVALSNEAATRELFLEALESRPTLLHIATHGIRPSRQGRASQAKRDAGTGLQLGGIDASVLTAEEIALLDLEHVAVAVIAACDAGLAAADSSEGVLGLQACLHAAGVHSIVTTLWPVDDRSTPFLMDVFYEGLLMAMPVEAAMQRAQKKTRERWRNPFHWGGWVVSGPSNFVPFKETSD